MRASTRFLRLTYFSKSCVGQKFTNWTVEFETSERDFQRRPYTSTNRVFSYGVGNAVGAFHQEELLPILLQRLSELGVLLFLLGFDLALRVVAIGNVLHDGCGRGLIDFVVRIIERRRKADENARQLLNLRVSRRRLECVGRRGDLRGWRPAFLPR